jgi:hypothetical protein
MRQGRRMTTTARASITGRQPGGNGMKFGLFVGGKVGGANPLGDSYGYRDFISYICDAEELGFESAFLVEHHFTGVGQLSASLNLLSYIAAKTRRIRHSFDHRRSANRGICHPLSKAGEMITGPSR